MAEDEWSGPKHRGQGPEVRDQGMRKRTPRGRDSFMVTRVLTLPVLAGVDCSENGKPPGKDRRPAGAGAGAPTPMDADDQLIAGA